jgi:plasmid stabilization system protein ParE
LPRKPFISFRGYDHHHRFGYGSYVIFYTVEDATLTIRRVLHGRMDVLRLLGDPSS